MTKVLLTGVAGQVGRELHAMLGEFGTVWAPVRSELDLERPDELETQVERWAPDIIVNAAAYTAVDRAEAEPQRAALVNAESPARLAAIAARSGALLVHYSTDYVFDGTGDGAYVEDAPTNPLSVYGRTKLQGEDAVRASGARHLILRTSWVYSPGGQNFLNTMVRLALERDALTVVDDQVGAPTCSADIARATISMLRYLAQVGEAAARALSSTYHVTSQGSVSWCGFAREIVRIHPALAHRRHVRVEPVPTSSYPTPARRPANSRLDNGRVERAFGIRMPHWRDAFAAALATQT
jgi:dTDP-4-dehydrorhamnose reductase